MGLGVASEDEASFALQVLNREQPERLDPLHCMLIQRRGMCSSVVVTLQVT